MQKVVPIPVPSSEDTTRHISRSIQALAIAVILAGVAVVSWFVLPVLPSSVYLAAAFLGALGIWLRVTSRAHR